MLQSPIGLWGQAKQMWKFSILAFASSFCNSPAVLPFETGATRFPNSQFPLAHTQPQGLALVSKGHRGIDVHLCNHLCRRGSPLPSNACEAQQH